MFVKTILFLNRGVKGGLLCCQTPFCTPTFWIEYSLSLNVKLFHDTMMYVNWRVLSSPTQKMEGRPLSAVCCCVFSIFPYSLYTWKTVICFRHLRNKSHNKFQNFHSWHYTSTVLKRRHYFYTVTRLNITLYVYRLSCSSILQCLGRALATRLYTDLSPWITEFRSLLVHYDICSGQSDNAV